jgi:hypothetical protein
MTRTAKRRFSRELTGIVDGLAIGAHGPVLVHHYEPPADDMWMDDVIPGKLAALERATGDVLWSSPCEVGYGRGFGAGFASDGAALVLGPTAKGHMAVRMALANGALLAAHEIEAFDDAIVHEDMAITVTPKSVVAYDSRTLIESWEYSRPGERYHHVARAGNRVFISVTHSSRKHGILCLDAENGEFQCEVLSPRGATIHGIAASGEGLVVLTRDLQSALPREVVGQFMIQLSRLEDSRRGDTLSLLALPVDSSAGDAPLWWEILSTQPVDEIPEVAVSADSGKLYLVNEALIEVRDMLTGRKLGDWAIPGLDERVAWQVANGAGLLAEESRVSLFELPA